MVLILWCLERRRRSRACISRSRPSRGRTVVILKPRCNFPESHHFAPTGSPGLSRRTPSDGTCAPADGKKRLNRRISCPPSLVRGGQGPGRGAGAGPGERGGHGGDRVGGRGGGRAGAGRVHQGRIFRQKRRPTDIRWEAFRNPRTISASRPTPSRLLMPPTERRGPNPAERARRAKSRPSVWQGLGWALQQDFGIFPGQGLAR